MNCRLDNFFTRVGSALPIVGDVLLPIVQHHLKSHLDPVLVQEDYCKLKKVYNITRLVKDIVGVSAAVTAFALLFYVFIPPAFPIALIIGLVITAVSVYYGVDGIFAAINLSGSSGRAKANRMPLDFDEP